jgi:hypothetical protein
VSERTRIDWDALFYVCRRPDATIEAIAAVGRATMKAIDAVFDAALSKDYPPNYRNVTNAPGRVEDVERYWTSGPDEHSARCQWWMKRIEDGWRPNRRINTLGYHEMAEYFGVYIWEYLNVIYPVLEAETLVKNGANVVSELQAALRMVDDAYVQHGEKGWKVYEGDGASTSYDYGDWEVHAETLQQAIRLRRGRLRRKKAPHGR